MEWCISDFECFDKARREPKSATPFIYGSPGYANRFTPRLMPMLFLPRFDEYSSPHSFANIFWKQIFLDTTFCLHFIYIYISISLNTRNSQKDFQFRFELPAEVRIVDHVKNRHANKMPRQHIIFLILADSNENRKF